ncbi:DUF6545 domain-containing protein [Rhodococcus erythropolis]|uniref:DUF6545 domain-containing protein n=1 Tax=Rhodococcus erythropolis TaxID=1833 RepID=UPI00294A541F|nr:DUF6545 domain-containing protein [Rhodococcus erythropolis]MDV6277533.1 DUF6545 domain-containing protein [Rhodococcus erythropolis]
MMRREPQRPLLYLLIVFAISTLIVQSWFARKINEITGIAQCNYLLQGLWGVLNAAVALEFVIHLAHGNNQLYIGRKFRVGLALGSAASMAVLFAVTPPSSRFNSASLTPSFALYSLVAGLYTICVAAVAAGMLLRHLPQVRGRVLSLALVCIAVGTGALAPVVTILTLQRLTGWVTPELRNVAFWISISRLLLVPFGCLIAAMEPVRIALTQRCRNRRLHRLWDMLRQATPELELVSEPAPWEEVPTSPTSKSWRQLHRRVVRINDSIHHLHHSWATEELLVDAAEYAAKHLGEKTRESTEMACWVEVTRRMALADSPKCYSQLESHPFGKRNTEMSQGCSTSFAEMRRLMKLDRALHSKNVQEFATKYCATGAAL